MKNLVVGKLHTPIGSSGFRNCWIYAEGYHDLQWSKRCYLTCESDVRRADSCRSSWNCKHWQSGVLGRMRSDALWDTLAQLSYPFRCQFGATGTLYFPMQYPMPAYKYVIYLSRCFAWSACHHFHVLIPVVQTCALCLPYNSVKSRLVCVVSCTLIVC